VVCEEDIETRNNCDEANEVDVEGLGGRESSSIMSLLLAANQRRLFHVSHQSAPTPGFLRRLSPCEAL